VFLLCPFQVVCSVEDPVAVVGDEGFDGGYFGVGEEHTGGDYVGVFVGCGCELGEGCALGCVVETAVEIDGYGLREDTGGDGHCDVVFRVCYVAGEGGHFGEAVGLCFYFGVVSWG